MGGEVFVSRNYTTSKNDSDSVEETGEWGSATIAAASSKWIVSAAANAATMRNRAFRIPPISVHTL